MASPSISDRKVVELESAHVMILGLGWGQSDVDNVVQGLVDVSAGCWIGCKTGHGSAE